MAATKALKSKQRKTHKGIKDQKSDSSESTLGDIRQRNMKALEYEEQSHLELFGCSYFSLPKPFNFEHVYSFKNEMKWSIVLLSGGRVFKVCCEMNCRWVFWLDPFFLLLVLHNRVLVNHEIAADWAHLEFEELPLGWVLVAATHWGMVEVPRPHITLCRDEAGWGSHLRFAVLRLGVFCCSICSHHLIGP